MTPFRDEAPIVVFADARDEGRAMRVTWHPEAQKLVVSLWRGDLCVATHQLAPSEMARLGDLIGDSLAEALTSSPR